MTNRVHLESNFTEFLVIEHVASVKEKGGLGHGFVDLFIVVRLELVPLGQDAERVGAIAGFVRDRWP